MPKLRELAFIKDLSVLDKQQRYTARAIQNADKDIGPWLSTTILKNSKKRAKKYNMAFDIDREYLEKLWKKQRGLCSVSGVKLQVISGSREEKNPYIASLDRINNEKGYVKGNVRFVCHWINNAKSTFDNKVLYEFVSAIAQKQIIRNK